MPILDTKTTATGLRPTVGTRRGRTILALALALAAIAALTPPSLATASPNTGVVTIKTVAVGSPGNPAVGIVPFTDAIYSSCEAAPKEKKECMMVGGVKYAYGIGQLEVTDAQWVTFLNTADPTGRDPHKLYSETESGSLWPKYGAVDYTAKTRKGRHYTVASPEWADKPYAFANFLRSARFVNSLYNGTLLAKKASSEGSFKYVTYRVRLSPDTETGMYDMRTSKHGGPTRTSKTGFVVPSQNEWIKAAYYDPNGGGTYSYWKYPTNPGKFGEGTKDAPTASVLANGSGDVANAATQPLATFRTSTKDPAPSWCPAAVSAEACLTVNPFGLDATTYASIYAGSVGTVGQAKTPSPWGTLDQGGNAVEWTDTITKSPAGNSDGRTWRRLHGGIANSTAYQMWISAVGLQPQDNAVFTATYPWLGIRVGVVGDLKISGR